MRFEFDPNKNRINLQKHGIDFSQAEMLWQDNNAVVVESKFAVEKRFLLIGKIGDTYWQAVFTMRDDNIRIISVYRAKQKYIKIYEHLP